MLGKWWSTEINHQVDMGYSMFMHPSEFSNGGIMVINHEFLGVPCCRRDRCGEMYFFGPNKKPPPLEVYEWLRMPSPKMVSLISNGWLLGWAYHMIPKVTVILSAKIMNILWNWRCPMFLILSRLLSFKRPWICSSEVNLQYCNEQATAGGREQEKNVRMSLYLLVSSLIHSNH